MFSLFSRPTHFDQVIYADETDGRLYDEHLLRKQELRELKMLQKAEQKQFQDLTVKAQAARDQQVTNKPPLTNEKRISFVSITFTMADRWILGR